jgi:hypothetical protein
MVSLLFALPGHAVKYEMRILPEKGAPAGARPERQKSADNLVRRLKLNPALRDCSHRCRLKPELQQCRVAARSIIASI